MKYKLKYSYKDPTGEVIEGEQILPCKCQGKINAIRRKIQRMGIIEKWEIIKN